MKSATPFIGPQIAIVDDGDCIREERISENEAIEFYATKDIIGWAITFEKVGPFQGKVEEDRLFVIA